MCNWSTASSQHIHSLQKFLALTIWTLQDNEGKNELIFIVATDTLTTKSARHGEVLVFHTNKKIYTKYQAKKPFKQHLSHILQIDLVLDCFQQL